MFSGNSYHSLASTMNLVNNFQLKLLSNENDAIRTTNAPLHRNQTKISKGDIEIYSMLLPMGTIDAQIQAISCEFCNDPTHFSSYSDVLLHFVLRLDAIQRRTHGIQEAAANFTRSLLDIRLSI